MKPFVGGVAVVMALCLQFTALRPIEALADTRPISILAFGDSLTAGYQLPPDQSFPAQLQMALEKKGHKVQITNAGVSGDTSTGGLERLEWTMQTPVDAVILELGGNDALRGVDPQVTRTNLDKMLTVIASKRVDVLLAGMKSPGNWGADYQTKFDAIYPELAQKHGVALYPFFLDGVFTEGDAARPVDASLIMADGLHPTSKGVATVVERILPSVEALIARVAARRAAAQ